MLERALCGHQAAVAKLLLLWLRRRLEREQQGQTAPRDACKSPEKAAISNLHAN